MQALPSPFCPASPPVFLPNYSTHTKLLLFYPPSHFPIHPSMWIDYLSPFFSLSFLGLNSFLFLRQPKFGKGPKLPSNYLKQFNIPTICFWYQNYLRSLCKGPQIPLILTSLSLQLTWQSNRVKCYHGYVKGLLIFHYLRYVLVCYIFLPILILFEFCW